MKIVTFNAPAETITDKPMFRDAFGRPEITPHNWISQQSRAGMSDEGLGIAAIGWPPLLTASIEVAATTAATAIISFICKCSFTPARCS